VLHVRSSEQKSCVLKHKKVICFQRVDCYNVHYIVCFELRRRGAGRCLELLQLFRLSCRSSGEKCERGAAGMCVCMCVWMDGWMDGEGGWCPTFKTSGKGRNRGHTIYSAREHQSRR
uniref:Uncharacterized protein n=1 Tax=Oryzias melastigma TaxID=30732 RepID=A0A3B3BVJ7_ORYME